MFNTMMLFSEYDMNYFAFNWIFTCVLYLLYGCIVSNISKFIPLIDVLVIYVLI